VASTSFQTGQSMKENGKGTKCMDLALSSFLPMIMKVPPIFSSSFFSSSFFSSCASSFSSLLLPFFFDPHDHISRLFLRKSYARKGENEV